MRTAEARTKATIKNILCLTDFSQPSEAAIPFAAAIARGYGATVHAMHILIPGPYLYTTPELTPAAIEAEEEYAMAEMQRIESQLSGLRYETIVERGTGIWAHVERVIKDRNIDMLVLGTHGRTGAEKFLLGSVAEEIFRRSPVPVLTIGPHVISGVHSGGRFHRVLLATDFTPESVAAAPYAVSQAEESHARLLLLHVIPSRERPNCETCDLSVAEAIFQLYELVPDDAKLEHPPEVAVEYGDPAQVIVDVAKRRGADLIVVGVRAAAGRVGAATHLERATAHKIVAHAECPVLTVRG